MKDFEFTQFIFPGIVLITKDKTHDMKIAARNKRKRQAAGKVAILLVILLFMIACEKEGDGPDYNPPGDHTISQDGFMHKSGLNQPLTNCVSCHGSDLEGGNTGVSCYECHGEKW